MTVAAAAYTREQLRVSQLSSFMLSAALALRGFIKTIRETSKSADEADERLREHRARLAPVTTCAHFVWRIPQRCPTPLRWLHRSGYSAS
jgi:hypothetical protein